MFSQSRPGVLVLLHPDSNTYYVEAARDLPRLARDIEFELERGMHSCDSLQELYERDSQVQFLLLDCPSFQEATFTAKLRKQEFNSKNQLINDDTYNPIALIGYH